MTTFQAGKTYETCLVSDGNLKVRVTVAKRTEKSVTLTDGKTYRIKNFGAVEAINLGESIAHLLATKVAA